MIAHVCVFVYACVWTLSLLRYNCVKLLTSRDVVGVSLTISICVCVCVCASVYVRAQQCVRVRMCVCVCLIAWTAASHTRLAVLRWSSSQHHRRVRNTHTTNHIPNFRTNLCGHRNGIGSVRPVQSPQAGHPLYTVPSARESAAPALEAGDSSHRCWRDPRRPDIQRPVRLPVHALSGRALRPSAARWASISGECANQWIRKSNVPQIVCIMIVYVWPPELDWYLEQKMSVGALKTGYVFMEYLIVH